jgi:hypothetical protein
MITGMAGSMEAWDGWDNGYGVWDGLGCVNVIPTGF